MLNYLEFAPIVAASSITFFMLLIMTPIAHQWGLVDRPDNRKRHSGLVPLTGGFAMFIAILLTSYLTDVWLKNDPLYFTAAAFIILLGMLDDRFNLSAKGRLVCQFGVAAIMAWAAQNNISSLGNIFGFGDVDLGPFGYIFTLVCVVGVINAFNMIDGIDGLAGGISIIVLLSLVLLLLFVERGASIMAPLIVVAALVPFLAFNLSIKGFKGNKIFMGDSGSMFMGLTIVWLLVEFTQGKGSNIRPITAVWLIGLPLLDMAAIMYRRARKGQSMLRPDRQHLHNIFMRAGLCCKQALACILFIGLSFAGIGIIGEIFAVPEPIMFWGFIGLLIIYTIIIQNIWKVLRFLRTKIIRTKPCDS